ncbi:MAG: 30S ribosomal protein S20 [Candidatus Babeliales bacterium]|jgi:small subunit ribosomal protein S20
MPNIKSAKKRDKQNTKRHVRNISRKSAIKSSMKKVVEAIENNDIDQAKELLKKAQAQLARAKSKRVLHANTAGRKIGRLAKKVAAAERIK